MSFGRKMRRRTGARRIDREIRKKASTPKEAADERFSRAIGAALERYAADGGSVAHASSLLSRYASACAVVAGLDRESVVALAGKSFDDEQQSFAYAESAKGDRAAKTALAVAVTAAVVGTTDLADCD